jgi:DNA-binding FadR family transcriptional regulator
MTSIFTDFPQAELSQRIELDKEFHYLLIRMADNTMFSVIMDSLSTVYHQWIEIVWHHASSEVMHNLHEAHYGIYESLIHNDARKGIEAIEYHYDIIDALSFHQWEKKDSCADFQDGISKDIDDSADGKVF